MLTAPRFGVLVATCAGLALATALAVIPPYAFWSRVAPERYLAGVEAFTGPVTTSDDVDATRVLPASVRAWRRLVGTRVDSAFFRLMTSATPAGRLYGLAGLRLTAPVAADAGARLLHGGTDSLYVNSGCGEGRMPLSQAVRELDAPGWADSLLRARPGPRAACALTNR